MRLKKQKRARRSVRFYTSCFGFREPFKILCDGTFVHHILHSSISQSQISKFLSASTKLFVTGCILAELKSLGDSHSDSLRSAGTLQIARCVHERRKSAANCIVDVIGKSNSEHFFVATQDADLRSKFHEIPGVPMIYALRNALFLETPSTYQRDFAKSTEEERLHVSEPEYNMLKKRVAMQVVATLPDADDALGNEVSVKQAMAKTENARKLGVAEKSIFKRKRAKGPNPLSCRKKKSSGPSHSQPQNAEIEGGTLSKRKRNRKRKRRQEESKLAETAG